MYGKVSMDFVDAMRRAVERLPPSEFDLRRQLWRAATSIPMNVAEGYRRKSRGAYRIHVSIAFGSQAEVETRLEIIRRNQLLGPDACQDSVALTHRVGAMLNRLLATLEE